MLNELGRRRRNVKVVILVKSLRIDNVPELDVMTLFAKIQLERIAGVRLTQLLPREQPVAGRRRRQAHYPDKVAAVTDSAMLPLVVMYHAAPTAATSRRG